MDKCLSCGATLGEDAQFCPECGHKNEANDSHVLRLIVLPSSIYERAILAGVALSFIALILPFLSIAGYMSFKLVDFWFSWVFVVVLVAVALTILFAHRLPKEGFFRVFPFALGSVELGIALSIFSIVLAANRLIAGLISSVASGASNGATEGLGFLFNAASIVSAGIGLYLLIVGAAIVIYGGYGRIIKGSE